MANFDDKMGAGIVIDGSEMEQIHYSLLFDEYVDDEIREMEHQMREEKILKRVCWVKTLCFPIEFIITYFLLGKIWTKERIEQQKLFNAFLKNKVTSKEFSNKLMDISNLYMEKKHG